MYVRKTNIFLFVEKYLATLLHFFYVLQKLDYVEKKIGKLTIVNNFDVFLKKLGSYRHVIKTSTNIL